jgi:DNA replication factor GINS
MYDELFEIWKHELETTELQRFPDSFYSKVADYIMKLREESRMLDNRTVKARLLKKETRSANRMLRELIRVRCKKLIKLVAKGEKDQVDALTNEEEQILNGAAPFVDAYQAFVRSLLRGEVVKIGFGKEKHLTCVLRFLKDVPAIVGSDMKTYGPFKPEDVASLPIENSKILVKQRLAEKVEAS